MNIRVISIAICLLMITSISVSIPQNVGPVKLGGTIYVDDDNTSGIEDGSLTYPYNLIMEGVIAASSGDTVYVFSGTYRENVNIVKSLNLEGEDRDTTIIDGGGIWDVVKINADWVNISGFTVRNSGWHSSYGGIKLDTCNHVEIRNNIVTDTKKGIHSSSSNKVNITISGNKFFSNWDQGIWIQYCSYSSIINNEVALNNGGIFVISPCSDNTIAQNTILKNNVQGLRLSSTNNNKVYHNNFIENANQAYDLYPTSNDWHHPVLLEGNYWSDYLGSDDGSGTGKHAIAGDGIGDSLIPHPTAEFDYYPLMTPWSPNQPPLADAGPDQTVNEGDTVQLDASSSYDPDGDIETYEWDFDASDGLWWETGAVPDAIDPTASHIYGDDGVFIVTLRVTDNDNLSATDTCNVTVQNVDPTVTIESITMEVEIGLRVAGRKYNNVSIVLYEDGILLDYASIERIPGSPEEQMAWIPVSINFSKSYSATVTYTPEDPPNVGGNPVWIYIKSQNGSINKIHHTFNVQQSKKRDSEHWNHVEPWEVELNGYFIGLPFVITSHITDPGSDDETLTFTYGSQVKIVNYLNNPPNPDPYPSPEVNPEDIMDTTTLVYEGPGTVVLVVKDDDNIRLGVGEGTDLKSVG